MKRLASRVGLVGLVAGLLFPVSAAWADGWGVESPDYAIEAGRAGKGCAYSTNTKRQVAGTVDRDAQCFVTISVQGGVLDCDYAITKRGDQIPELEPGVGNSALCASSVLFCGTKRDDGDYHWLVQPAAVC
jgi:hypothetical protein